MDTAMRDLDQLRERGEQTTGRKVGLFALAGVLSVTAVLAMVLTLQDGDAKAAQPSPDLLAQLALAPSPTDPAAPSKSAEVRLDSLSFPTTLLDRDEVALEATVRAAEAEHEQLTGVARPGLDLPTPSVAEVPAAQLAGADRARLARVAKHDPMVAETQPTHTAETAPVGHEGTYTLQVVSYERREEAEEFAKTLRTRGHKAYVMQAEVPERGRFYRVRVGPFSARQEARDYQDKFEADEHMRTILVSNKDKHVD
ncbi:MAG: SPOR domain-containing protein [Myxococcales bacterium]